jgi:hypothetical protein
LLHDEEFKARHRAKPTVFTRVRALSFTCVMILLLKKSLKSLQLVLNEWSLEQETQPVTASAFTQARSNLRHTAFIELNQKAVVEVMYSDNTIKLYKGMRVLGIDGSKILLPQHQSIIQEFGKISYSNDHPEVQGSHAYALASVMYDVLNRVVLDSKLGKVRDYEVNLAIGHIAHSGENDLLILDRNYPSYLFLAFLVLSQRKFVIRCSQASFGIARKMLEGEGTDDQVVTLTPQPSKLKEIQHFDKLSTPQQVNYAVAFNAIKNKAFNLLSSDMDSETVIERLESLFRMNPTVNRTERIAPRIKRSARQRLNHIKRRLKMCF